jgi:HEAT repeat protein
MLRKSRTIAHLLRHLVLGVAGVGAISATALVLVGCDDESQPDYWVKKLDDPAKRPAAIKRLTQFYEDGLTKSNQNRETPEMKALLAKIVGPMAQTYIKGDLDDKTRIELLKSLANTRDPAAKDAIIHALKAFAAGKAHHEEMTQAALYVKQLKLKEAAGPLLDAFLKIKVSDKELGPPYIATQDAMMAIADPAWKTKLIELLNRPIAAIDEKKPDPKALAEAKNEVYWQTVAAALLGELKAPEAIKPLFMVVVTPEKKTVAGTAVVSLIKIGKPAVLPLLDILSGKDAAVVAASKKAGPNAYIQNAAIVLGTIGRSEARDPMIAALNAADKDDVRAVLGREMSKLPTSPEAIKALEGAFEKVAVDALVGQGDPARVVVAEAAEKFMDSSIVPWALKQVTVLKTAKGEKQDIDNIQVALLQSAMKVMKKDQVDEVKKLIDAEGDDLTKKAFQQAADLVNSCADNVGCYLAKIEDPAVQEKNGQFIGIKAAYMLGMLGNDSTKAELVKRLPKIKNDGVRAAAIQVIDHLSPNGDKKIADELLEYVETKMARGDKAPTDSYIKQVASRLQARAS